MDKPLKSVTHGQYNARPVVTFPATGHHRPLTLTGTKLHCLVKEAHVCEQLAQGCYLKVEWPGVEPAISMPKFWCHSTQLPEYKNICYFVVLFFEISIVDVLNKHVYI